MADNRHLVRHRPVRLFLALAPVATGTDDVMLTVFTTAAGFLAGLLSPSPLSEGG
jgi:hypothetical protein